ncbi:hypothetical protein M422DRAFT_53610 [Sphaerobolus stellatus SS14]|uniref:Protein kinase domain-containing protein n=1 Tax=Sphaerobolus stellatus (strain SS14) TaxID=990650 RepID=A0A0C9UPE7_SPHS4|nr:hypothetical protein M422DRAFT_53610 [Sphaerobolus stellatus SS14]
MSYDGDSNLPTSSCDSIRCFYDSFISLGERMGKGGNGTVLITVYQCLLGGVVYAIKRSKYNVTAPFKKNVEPPRLLHVMHLAAFFRSWGEFMTVITSNTRNTEKRVV